MSGAWVEKKNKGLPEGFIPPSASLNSDRADAPSPTPDRAAAELAEHEARVRAISSFMWPDDHGDSIALRAVLAELDRQRALIAEVLSEIEDWNPWTTTINEARAEIRALLGEEE